MHYANFDDKSNSKKKLRPHHIMCTIGFRGMGYSDAFVNNFTEIKDSLLSNHDVIVEIVEHTDSICSPCPNNIGNGRCTKQKTVKALDDKHAAILGIKHGDKLSWEECIQKVCEHMTVERFHKACEGCEWKTHGVCEDTLKNLLSRGPRDRSMLSCNM